MTGCVGATDSRLKPEDSDSFYADAGASKGDYDLILLGWLPDYPGIPKVSRAGPIRNEEAPEESPSLRSLVMAVAAARFEVGNRGCACRPWPSSAAR
jgi:hypothetical protein